MVLESYSYDVREQRLWCYLQAAGKILSSGVQRSQRWQEMGEEDGEEAVTKGGSLTDG
jgi:hypothetical protein